MVSNGNISAGEIGGIFAGAIALLATLGHGIKWLLGFTSAQQTGRQLKLDQWHRELTDRENKIEAEEVAYRVRIEGRLIELEGEQGKLLAICHQLAAAVRTLDPGSSALRPYDEMLRSAFRIDPSLPPEMIAELHEIDRADGSAGEKRRVK
ncbi:MAG: hypothetical protein QOG72_2471 [Sphingomonadales bacterium]|jgi:hypothetical protein|nr:hypothetical protein [Sphingomonadales bacterium]